MKISTKIHLTSAGLVLVVVLGMMTSLYMHEKKQLWTEINREQKDDLNKLTRVYSEARLEDNYLIILNYVKTLVSSDLVEYAGFVNEDGYGWIDPGPGKDLIFANDDPDVPKILQFTGLIRKDTMTRDKIPVITMTRPIREKKVTGFVRLAYSKSEIVNIVKARLQKTLNELMVVGLIAIIFGLILAHFISKRLSRPIIDLMNATKAIASGKKGITVKEAGKDELGSLTRTFNHMSTELEKLDQLKDEFMAHVTHELRSPLTSIIATVELMDEMPMTQKNARMKRSVDRLKYGSERLNKLVDNILDLTRMEAGKMSFNIEPINIAQIVTEMADFFTPRAEEKNLYIKSKVPSVFPMASADQEKIRQVLSNLIHNAIKFTNKGGITVWVKEIKGVIHVGVTDTGVGIPADKLNSVFSKFQTLQDTKDRVDKPVPGSGLGLNIVQNSIHAQKGKIWVESQMNKGTSFIFTLPTAQNKPKAHVPKKNENHANTQAPVEEKAVRSFVMMDKRDKAS